MKDAQLQQSDSNAKLIHCFLNSYAVSEKFIQGIHSRVLPKFLNSAVEYADLYEPSNCTRVGNEVKMSMEHGTKRTVIEIDLED